MKKSVYQSESYKEALKHSGQEVIEISGNNFAIEKRIKLPGFKEKRILETRGNLDKIDLEEFKKTSKDYFYGTIAPVVLGRDETKFKKAGYTKISNHTVLIDLKKTEEELWKNLEKKSARWGIKTAVRNGLNCEINRSEKDFAHLYEIYSETAKKSRFNKESKKFLASILSSNIAEIFIVKKDKSLIAGGVLLKDKDYNYTILDLTSANDQGLKLQAMPLLYWTMILYSKKQGFAYFDLGGYDKEAKKGSKLYKVNKFKERFGGKIVEQPIYSTNKKYSFLRGVARKMSFLKNKYNKQS